MAWESSAWNLEFVQGDGSLPKTWEEDEVLHRQGGRRASVLVGPRQGQRRRVRASPLFSGAAGLAIGGWALVSLRVSVTSKKAEHALLLLRGQ